MIHRVKGFGVVSKAKVDVFLELSCFFDDPADVSNLISGSSVFSKTSLNIWKFMVHVLQKPGLENFEHYFTSVWDECNCAVVWAFFGIAFLWVATAEFSNLLAYWVQHFHSIMFQDLKYLNWNSITSTSFRRILNLLLKLFFTAPGLFRGLSMANCQLEIQDSPIEKSFLGCGYSTENSEKHGILVLGRWVQIFFLAT